MRFLFIILLVFIVLQAKATHIVGGEITYRCLGNLKIEFSMTIFRDCYNGNPDFDSLARIVIYDDNWMPIDSIRQAPMGDDTLAIALPDPCFIAPPNVCVHRTTYRRIIDLPSADIGYKIVYQRCCRNELIRNIINPVETGATFLLELTPKAIQECNNSPRFRNWPPVAICVNQPIDFDHGADDVDGDSLVYELCAPLMGPSIDNSEPFAPPGPYPPVLWANPPYNLNNVLGGDPLSIDPQTGFLTGIPNTLGTFVVGICAKEYRDGELISVLRRDFQYNVSDCGRPTSAYQIPSVQCDDRTVDFDNQSQYVRNGYLWYFDLFGDTTLQSTEGEPSYTYPADTGTYTIMLVANPGDPCSDTSIQTIVLADNFLTADYEITYPACDSVLTLSVQDLSYDTVFPIVQWAWTVATPSGQLVNSSEPDPTFQFTEPGLHKMTLVVTSSNGCTRTLTKPFAPNFPDLSALDNVIRLCQGDSVGLLPMANPNFEYQWSPNFALSSDTVPNPTTFVQESMDYEVTVTNPFNNCSATGTASVEIGFPSGQEVYAQATPQYIPEGGSSQLEALFFPTEPAQGFAWSPAASLTNPNSDTTTAFPLDSTLYFVTVTEASGCTLTDSVWVFVVRGDVCVEPFIFFPTAFSPNGDNVNDTLRVEGNFIESLYWAIYDRWGTKIFEANSPDDAWDGTVGGEAVPPDVYGYFLQVGCPGGLQTIRQGNVTLLR